jgi:DNA-binding NtrC family response regulator
MCIWSQECCRTRLAAGSHGSIRAPGALPTLMASAPRSLCTAAATILIVDDDPRVRDVVAELLAEDGYQVRCAANGHEALAILASDEIDLVLSDVMMPQLDGPSFVRRLQAQGYHQPVVLMSAHVTSAVHMLPDVTFLPKPFDLDGLLRLVVRLLDGSQP